MSQFDKSQPRTNGEQESDETSSDTPPRFEERQNAYDIVEEDELAAGEGNGPPMTAEERLAKEQQWKTELEKVQDEIQTLRQVLASKLRRESELKRLLGTSVVAEIKQDFQSQIKTLKESTAYQKTSAGIKSAGDKITPAFHSFGASLSKKLDGVKNSTAFKSFGERLGNMKSRISTSRSEMSFEEALANARKDAPPGADGMAAPAAAPSTDKKPA